MVQEKMNALDKKFKRGNLAAPSWGPVEILDNNRMYRLRNLPLPIALPTGVDKTAAKARLQPWIKWRPDRHADFIRSKADLPLGKTDKYTK
jgi:hypothetical protein